MLGDTDLKKYTNIDGWFKILKAYMIKAVNE